MAKPNRRFKEKDKTYLWSESTTKTKRFSDFLDSSAFEEMLIKVANDDVISYKNNNTWLIHHPSEALIFKNLDNVWNELKSIYSTDFKNLVFGELPNQVAILETLKDSRKIKDNILDNRNWKQEIKFTEASLEKTFSELLGQEGFPLHLTITITRMPVTIKISILWTAKYSYTKTQTAKSK